MVNIISVPGYLSHLMWCQPHLWSLSQKITAEIWLQRLDFNLQGGNKTRLSNKSILTSQIHSWSPMSICIEAFTIMNVDPTNSKTHIQNQRTEEVQNGRIPDLGSPKHSRNNGKNKLLAYLTGLPYNSHKDNLFCSSRKIQFSTIFSFPEQLDLMHLYSRVSIGSILYSETQLIGS